LQLTRSRGIAFNGDWACVGACTAVRVCGGADAAIGFVVRLAFLLAAALRWPCGQVGVGMNRTSTGGSFLVEGDWGGAGYVSEPV
jgi:hypothetical protein